MLDRFPLFGELEVHGGGEHRTVESLRSRGYVIPVADLQWEPLPDGSIRRDRKPNSFVLTERGRAWRKARYEERMRWKNMGWERHLGQVV